VSTALFSALLTLGWKWLMDRDDEESVFTFIFDVIGNLIGGVPVFSDVYSFFVDGFEVENFLFDTVNNVLGAVADCADMLTDAVSGKEVTKQDAMKNLKKLAYALGQISGLPTRNVYNFITGIVRTSVVFWLPTYLNQYLGYPTKKAALIFTVATFMLTACSFAVIYVYEKLNRNVELTVFLAFLLSTCCFAAVWLIKLPVINTVFLVAAIFCSNGAASMLYSRYCPSLRDTGMVSSATGFLDFISYISAGISSTVFANAVSVVGWKGLVLIWFGLVLAGMLVSIPAKKKT
jgi:hypothetical protein